MKSKVNEPIKGQKHQANSDMMYNSPASAAPLLMDADIGPQAFISINAEVGAFIPSEVNYAWRFTCLPCTQRFDFATRLYPKLNHDLRIASAPYQRVLVDHTGRHWPASRSGASKKMPGHFAMKDSWLLSREVTYKAYNYINI